MQKESTLTCDTGTETSSFTSASNPICQHVSAALEARFLKVLRIRLFSDIVSMLMTTFGGLTPVSLSTN